MTTKETQLCRAAGQGSTYIVEGLLQQNTNPNVKDETGDSPLLLAILLNKDVKSKQNIVGLLIEHGADVNFRNTHGFTPLHVAVGEGNTSLVTKLLENGAEPNMEAKHGNTVLNFAILNVDDPETLNQIVDQLIEHKADVNIGNADGLSPLHLAILRRDCCIVKKMLTNGAKPNEKSKSGNTALNLAIREVKDLKLLDEIAKELIEHGADVNIKDGDGYPPVHLAILTGNLSMVKKLLIKGAKPNKKSKSGNTALNFAMLNVEDPETLNEIVDQLIEHKADVNIGDAGGFSPLHLAILKENCWIVKKLLAEGSDPNEKNKVGSSALHTAICTVNDSAALEEIVEELIRSEADVNIARNEDGGLPIHLAIAKGDLPLVKKLLENGANPNLKHSCGNNALHFAMRDLKDLKLLDEIANELIEHGAEVNTKDADGHPPVHLAILKGNLSMVKKLLSKDADANEKSKSGNTALNLAIRDVNDLKLLDEIVKELIAHGADVNIGDPDDVTPLLSAIVKGNSCVVKKLLHNKADPDKKPRSGNTAFQFAIIKVTDKETREEIVNQLIEHEANVNATDTNGVTPLHEASSHGHMSIVKNLLDHRADINVPDKKGNTPLHIAIVWKNKEIADLLINRGADKHKRDGCCQTAASLLDSLTQSTQEVRHAEFKYNTSEKAEFPVAQVFELNAINDADESNFQEVQKQLFEIPHVFSKRLKLFFNYGDGMNLLLTWLTFGKHKFPTDFLPKLSFLVKSTKDLEEQDFHGNNFLHVCIRIMQKHLEDCNDFCNNLPNFDISKSVMNAKNNNGWTPAHLLFYMINDTSTSNEQDNHATQSLKTCCNHLIKPFLNWGLEVTQTDNDRVSLVHCAAAKGVIEVLQILLEQCKKEFVNKGDRFGSTALHYAVYANCTKTVKCLLEKGCQKDIKDDKGRTAGDLAKLLGYGKLFHELEGATEIFDCKDEYKKQYIVSSEQHCTENIDYSALSKKMEAKFEKTTIEEVYSSLLKSPVLGSREYQAECFKQEAQFVKEKMMSLMSKLSEQHGQLFPNYAFEPRLRGSMAEDTKCGPPDEFDFMLVLNTFSKDCKLKSIDNCKAEIVTKEGIPMNLYKMLGTLLTSIRMVILNDTIWKESPLKFVTLEHTTVGGCLHLVFTGHVYKMLHISVDIVPCIPLGMQANVEMKIDWPYPLDFSKCQLYGLFRQGYNGFDLSSTDYEEVLLHSLPSAAKDAYVLGKAFGSEYFKFCGPNFGKIFKPSYTMKKGLLLSARKHADMQQVSRHSWIEGMISTLNNMDDYVKENECRRCIFHSQKWNRVENTFINLSC